MKDPRAGKRRRISDGSALDEDGDTAMHGNGDALENATEAAPLPAAETEPVSPLMPKSRRSSRAIQDNSSAESGAALGPDAQTPTRAGLRSSGRQRKAPQRFEEELDHTQSARKPRATPKSNGTTTQRSVQKTQDVSEVENDGGSPHPPAERRTRTRSNRASVRFNTLKDAETDNSDMEPVTTHYSPAPDDYYDNLEDIVSMQLQQDFNQDGLDGKDEATLTSKILPDYAAKFQAQAHDGLTIELRLLSRIILEKLSGKRHIPLKGLDSEYLKVNQLIEQTVSVGEGNSMLLLGSRGSGKTAVVETSISYLTKAHKNDFHVVRLNGFLHTDDRLALREIWRQLGRETNTEEEAGKVSSYAETMATLLALLSHPEDLFGPSSDPEAVTTAKSIIIILDEFDLFVTHSRQTLLYNLFDIAQAKKAPLAVLGLTTKVDVTEMLEKRVKSRFSHRSVYVPLPRTFEVFSEICLAGLNLDDDEISELTGGLSSEDLSIVKSERWGRLIERWHQYLQGLCADATFQSHLRRIYHQTKSVKEFFTSALIGMAEMHHSTYCDSTSDVMSPASFIQIPTPTTFTSNLLSCPDPAPLPFSASTTASASPSSLPLSLLLAASRLTALYDPGLEAAQTQDLAPLALSFPAAYAEYVRLLTSAKTSASVSGATVTPGRVWGRDVAREAWEKLVSWGLISPVGGGSGTADGRMFRVEISFEEAVEMAGSGGSLGRWWRDA